MGCWILLQRGSQHEAANTCWGYHRKQEGTVQGKNKYLGKKSHFTFDTQRSLQAKWNTVSISAPPAGAHLSFLHFCLRPVPSVPLLLLVIFPSKNCRSIGFLFFSERCFRHRISQLFSVFWSLLMKKNYTFSCISIILLMSFRSTKTGQCFWREKKKSILLFYLSFSS